MSDLIVDAHMWWSPKATPHQKQARMPSSLPIVAFFFTARRRNLASVVIPGFSEHASESLVSLPSFSPFICWILAMYLSFPFWPVRPHHVFKLELAARVPAQPPASSATCDHLICVEHRSETRVFRVPALNSMPPWTPSFPLASCSQVWPSLYPTASLFSFSFVRLYSTPSVIKTFASYSYQICLSSLFVWAFASI
jgi:hypothetical protein